MMGPRATLKARRRGRLLADAIDRAYYVSQLEAPPPYNFDPVEHYLGEGGRLLIDPTPEFDSRYYLDTYSDVAASGLPPFVHYLEHGLAEGRTALYAPADDADLRPWFDTEWYLSRYPEVAEGLAAANIDALYHFMHYGWREGRDPSPWFSLAGWREANPQAPEDENPFAMHFRHRLRRGWRLAPGGRTWTPETWSELHRRVADSGLADDRYYFSTYPELAGRGLSVIDHYLIIGAAELRNPGPAFDTGWWADRRGVSFADALIDFLDNGEGAAGRRPLAATFDPEVATPGAVAIHLLLINPLGVDNLAEGLADWPAGTHVWASVRSEPDAVLVRRRLAVLAPQARVDIRIVADLPRNIAPVAFADRAREVEAILCLRSDRPLRPGQAEALFAAPTQAGQAAAWLSAHAELGALCAETERELRLRDEGLRGGQFETSLWLKAAALPALAARVRLTPAALRPHPDPDLAIWKDMFDGLGDLGLTWSSFNSAERRRLAFTPSPAPAPLRPYADAGGRLWAREEPAMALRRPRPVNPRSKVYDPSRLDIAWVMPDLLKGSGGHMSILRLVEQLAEFGHRQTIWIQNPRDDNPLAIKSEMQRDFRPIPESVAVVPLPDDMRALSADAVIATEAWSAFPVSNVANAKARFYLIQDHEPSFYPVGDIAALADQTYRLGLDALTAGDWLLGKAEQAGMWARKWDLAVDAGAYFPPVERSEREGPPRIVVYARRSTPRRAVKLAFAALTELHRRGVAFEAVLFGDEHPPTGLTFPHVHVGVAPPERLGELYRVCDIGLVFSATNYSLVPLEMMACDLPVVELDGESTRAVFTRDEVVFAAPDGHAVADALAALCADPKARARQAARGRGFVKELTWTRSARQVEAALLERLAESGATAIDTAAVCAPAVREKRRVSVVIPTYNGGRLFDRVLAAAASQDCPFDYDVLVIDSGSTDRTAEVASKVGGRVWLHHVDKADFQHGRTRNLGVELTDGDVVAFLTQDALPGDRLWLRRLVEGFDASERTALVFGRHRAYPAHGLYAARDLDGLFDMFRELGPLHSNRLGLLSTVYAGGEDWRRLIGFHSDNNSALLRAAWKHLPYPEIDWGEDQVLGWEMVRQGFDKAYADEAVVFHSHQRKASEQLETAVEEGRLFKREFGMDLVRPGEAAGLLAAMQAADIAWGEARGLTEGMIAMRLESLKLTIDGRVQGAAEVEEA